MAPDRPSRRAFPNLTDDNHRVLGPPSFLYNCIAWAAGDDGQWWWPSGRDHWPSDAPLETTVPAFVAVFRGLGYGTCPDGAPEPGFEKVALYATAGAGGALVPTHAARQLPDGRWSSKLGKRELIEHDTPDDVSGPLYGAPVRYLRRPRA